MGQLKVSIGQYSSQGPKAENQDSMASLAPQQPLLDNKGMTALIADGVSSCGQGKQASEACVKGFIADYYSTPDSWTVKTSAHRVLTAINSWLTSQSQALNIPGKGMLTTLSCLIIRSTTAHLFHVGDTRIYRLQKNSLECLTKDHRMWISNDNNYLSRAMGFDVHLDIDYRHFEVEAGDIYLLSSDGLHDFISEKEIIDVIHSHMGDLNSAAKILVDKALANHGNDNASCMILHIDALAVKDADEIYSNLSALPFPPPLEKGMILDGFRIVEEIHSSKRTHIYKAEEIDSGKSVCIKAPSPNYDDDAVYIENFIHEEWVGKRINNKHVVKIITPKQSKQCLYYVTEYISGQSLRQWMKQHSQPNIGDVRELVRQIAAGLRAFHRLEMLHQDLKPENIMLTKQGDVKIIDFGSTKIAGLAEIHSPLERVALLGTKNYTAPEYLLGLSGSNRSDIFSLGVITYEMLTGKLPYGNDIDGADNSTKQSKLRYRSSCGYNPMIPLWIDKAIAKAVNPNPKMRYDLLSEFVHDLNTPNPRFLVEGHVPFIEKDPLKFWKILSLLLALSNLALLFYFFRPH